MMTFSVRDRMLFCSSNRPGSHVTLFGPTGQLSFRNDASSFDDANLAYTWAFALDDVPIAGQRFVFATTSWNATGVVGDNGTIVLAERPTALIRSLDGKPLRVLTAAKTRPPGDDPQVSIITCTYNRPKMLRECTNSMLAQTCRSWEHLICDDGSPDRDAQIVLDEIAASDERFRVFYRAHVDQPAQYWNEMIDRARGRYIGFLDDDNWKYPDFVERLASVLDAEPSVDMVTCGWTVYDRDGNPNDCHHNLKTTDDIFRYNTVDTGAFLIRREAMEKIGYFPLDIRTNEDWAMMRRAATCLQMLHLPEALAVYRTHAEQRLEYREKLGNERDKAIIEGSVWGPSYGVRVFSPSPDRLTQSQRDVVDGVSAGIAAIPWIEDGSDLAVILMPFQMDVAEAVSIAASHRTVVIVHSEDPFALHPNLERARAMARVRDETWICSNDTTCLEEYRATVGPRLVVCPSLSINDGVVDDGSLGYFGRIDALLVGYAYPSRVSFLRALSLHMDIARVKIVGDGWVEAGFAARKTSPYLDTYRLYGHCRAVICLHRGHGDCVDGPHEPKLVQRGYVEGMGGARVFVDTSRPDHALDEGEVEWFTTPEDLAAKLTAYLALPDEEQARLAEPLRERAWRDFTYRTRMARVINAVRSRRFMAQIP